MVKRGWREGGWGGGRETQPPPPPPGPFPAMLGRSWLESGCWRKRGRINFPVVAHCLIIMIVQIYRSLKKKSYTPPPSPAVACCHLLPGPSLPSRPLPKPPLAPLAYVVVPSCDIARTLSLSVAPTSSPRTPPPPPQASRECCEEEQWRRVVRGALRRRQG